MKIKYNKNSILLSLVLLFLIFIFGFLKLPTMLIIAVAVLSFLLMIFSTESLFILNIIIYLSNGFIPREDYILGIVGIHQIVTLITLLALIVQKKRNKIEYNALGENIKYANKIIIFIVVYTLFVSFKNVYFNLFNTTLESALFKSINFIVMSLTVILIPTRLKDHKSFYNSLIQNIILFFSVSALVSKYFMDIGFYTTILSSDIAERSYGFIGNGDSNTLGLVMVIGVAYLLAINKRGANRLTIIVLISLAIAAIGASGSRSGFVLLLLIILLFIYYSKEISTFFKRVIIVSLFAIILFPLLIPNIERIDWTGDEQSYREGSTSNRIGKWIFYINYFRDDPTTLLRGGKYQLEIGFNKSYRAAHNFYIQVVYGAGIIMLLYYLYLLWKIYGLRNLLGKGLIMILLPIVIGLTYISDYGALLFFAIVLSSFEKKIPSIMFRRLSYHTNETLLQNEKV